MAYQWTRITTSQVVSKTACLVGSVIVTPDAADSNADVTLYDGESATDPEIITVRSGSGATRAIVLMIPMVFERGLYIAKGSNVEECLIQWEVR